MVVVGQPRRGAVVDRQPRVVVGIVPRHVEVLAVVIVGEAANATVVHRAVDIVGDGELGVEPHLQCAEVLGHGASDCALVACGDWLGEAEG